ncbi:hypothetical protein NAP1_00950 [Erythrobacter sp. NAP1]|uniref:hypothetical protein n=1 Tax=Erythrobacter sp. NAP1 TaxID=237727 RepID=UPI0000686E65|nr:hypothetical protein [Erythrobacter sp. NAP1]EAQ29296.1 hypothetical protein NAP1_00950 [Erythrobacter sp. NAP1]
MITPGSRIRQMGWVAVLAACVALFALLSFQVQTVRSEVLLAEREIIGLEREVQMLETEFQTRASQRQLAEWNAVELGYQAPRADQYLDNERQLASLGVPVGPNAPSPIRVARANLAGPDAEPREMVSPITGAPVTLASLDAEEDAGAVFTEAFGDFLIEASPIRPARAQGTSAPPPGNVALMSAEISQ